MTDSEISQYLIKKIIEAPELQVLINNMVAERVARQTRIPEYFTREQLATIWKVSKQTVDRMTEEALNDRGYVRLKIGNSVRFERA